MDILKLREVLRKEYGIETEDDLQKAIKNCGGVQIGIFVSPIPKSGD